MGLSYLKSIYNPLAKMEENRTESISPEPMKSYKDSAPILLLSEYLKENNGHGIRIIQRNGIPVLLFEPGLSLKDPDDRWRYAHDAEVLFWSAIDDLKFCITNNLITLKEG